MQSQRRQDKVTSTRDQNSRRPYERPAIIYNGKISIRAGSPIGRIGPPGGPDTLFDG